MREAEDSHFFGLGCESVYTENPRVASGEGGGAEPEIEVEATEERVVVLRLLGDHDLASANALTEALALVLESGRSVVLDVRSARLLPPRAESEEQDDGSLEADRSSNDKLASRSCAWHRLPSLSACAALGARQP